MSEGNVVAPDPAETQQPTPQPNPNPPQPGPAPQPAPQPQPQPGQPDPNQPGVGGQPKPSESPDDGVPAGGSENKPPREAVIRDDGPFQTRTGQPAMQFTTGKGDKRSFTAGGDKGAAIQHLLKTRGQELSRKDIAALVGCSVSRVAEVARVIGVDAAKRRSAPEQPAPDSQEAQPVAS